MLWSDEAFADGAGARNWRVLSWKMTPCRMVRRLQQVTSQVYCWSMKHRGVCQVTDTLMMRPLRSQYKLLYEFTDHSQEMSEKVWNVLPSCKCTLFQTDKTDKSYSSAPEDVSRRRANRPPLVRHNHSPTSPAGSWASISVWKSRPKYLMYEALTYTYSNWETPRRAPKTWWRTRIWMSWMMQFVACQSRRTLNDLRTAALAHYEVDCTTHSPAGVHVWSVPTVPLYCVFEHCLAGALHWIFDKSAKAPV